MGAGAMVTLHGKLEILSPWGPSLATTSSVRCSLVFLPHWSSFCFLSYATAWESLCLEARNYSFRVGYFLLLKALLLRPCMGLGSLKLFVLWEGRGPETLFASTGSRHLFHVLSNPCFLTAKGQYPKEMRKPRLPFFFLFYVNSIDLHGTKSSQLSCEWFSICCSFTCPVISVHEILHLHENCFCMGAISL